jgi:hypothetical protein
MRMSRRGFGLSLLTTFLVNPAWTWAAEQPSKAQEVKIVKYTQLGDLVKKHRGQVVVVDFWATF